MGNINCESDVRKKKQQKNKKNIDSCKVKSSLKATFFFFIHYLKTQRRPGYRFCDKQ